MEKNKLKEIFELQDQLGKQFYPKLGIDNSITKLSDEKKKQISIKLVNAVQIELSEVLESCGVEWWKNKNFTIDHLKEEWIDVLHFVIQAMILLGISADDCFSLYVKKNNHNHIRKDWSNNAINQD